MKFIHCSDLHLDAAFSTLPKEKGSIRKEEILTTFERLCEYAKENAVAAVIIAGDMFDSVKVRARTKERVLHAIRCCNGTDFLYLSGNHDSDNFLNGLEEFPENLKVFNDKWTYYEYGKVKIGGISLNSDNVLSFYDDLKFDADGINIAVLHGQIAGYKSQEKAEIISIPRLKGKNIDYLALGHIHYYSEDKIDNRGRYVYSGCLDGRGFDETGEKGFVLLDVDDSGINSKFLPFYSRCLYTEEIKIDNGVSWYDFQDKIIDELTEKYSDTSLLKVVLTGEHDINLNVDIDNFTDRLNRRFFFAKVYDETVLKILLEDFKDDKSIRGEFIREVLNSSLSEDDKNSVIKCGLNAFAGDDIL